MTCPLDRLRWLIRLNKMTRPTFEQLIDSIVTLLPWSTPWSKYIKDELMQIPELREIIEKEYIPVRNLIMVKIARKIEINMARWHSLNGYMGPYGKSLTLMIRKSVSNVLGDKK